MCAKKAITVKEPFEDYDFHINGHDYDRSQGPKVAVIGQGGLANYTIRELLGEDVAVTDWISPKFNGGKYFDNVRGIDIHEPKGRNIDSTVEQLVDQGVDYFILGFCSKVINEDTLEAHGSRFLNLHPGILPFYRGANPMEDMRSNGHKISAVNVLEVTPQVDEGHVLALEYFNMKYPLVSTDRGPKKFKTACLWDYKTAIEIGSGLVARVLESKDSIVPVSQRSLASRYLKDPQQSVPPTQLSQPVAQ